MSAGYSGAEICSTVFGSEYCLLYDDPGLNYAENNNNNNNNSTLQLFLVATCS